MVFFSVIMYGYESWTIKKAEHRRIDAFELWCWRRHLRVPWTSRRSNQYILKEISPEYSLEKWSWFITIHWWWSWNSNTLVNWCEELTHWERFLKTGKEEDDRGWDGLMASLTQWTWVWGNSRSWWWTRRPGVLWSIGSRRVRHNWMNWTEATEFYCYAAPVW